MSNKARIGSLVAVVLIAGFLVYTFTAPYARFPGIRIGGELTAPPADFRSINDEGVVTLKLGGFPPFVARVFYSTDAGGIITATRPDGGYWGERLRASDDPHGWIRIGDNTYALSATEITGEARLPYLESYGSKNNMPMRFDFEGEVIRGENEPLHTWEVFYWTPRG